MIQIKCVLKNKKREIFITILNFIQFTVLILIILNIIKYKNYLIKYF
jgi:hypothetical protein